MGIFYIRLMKSNPLGRWIFALTIIGFIFFCYWSFRVYLRTSSDPFTAITADAKWVWVIHDWNQVKGMDHEEGGIPILEKWKNDMDLWSEWSGSISDINVILSQEKIIWVSSDSLMKSGFWCFGVPDNWSSHRIDELCARVPHLQRLDDVLVWTMDGSGLENLGNASDEDKQFWEQDYQTVDHAVPLALIGKNQLCRFALEQRKGDWWGYVIANSDLMGSIPLDTLLPLKIGKWCEAAYQRNIPNIAQDSAIKSLSGSFRADTTCQCDAWRNMMDWQPFLGVVHFSAKQGVTFSQRYIKNPLIGMRALYADTSAAILKLKQPDFFSGSIYPGLETNWQFAAKRKGFYTVTNDSSALVSYLSDSTLFTDLAFEHSFPNHPVLLGIHRSAGMSPLMPMDLTLIKGLQPYRVQVYWSGTHRWVVQLNQVQKIKE
jgi:hypothetical protein